jgi:hypothetical protein
MKALTGTWEVPMKHHNTIAPSVRWNVGILTIGLFCLLYLPYASAGGFRPPEACETFTGEEHLQCLYTYITMQGQPSKAGEPLRATETPQQLDEQYGGINPAGATQTIPETRAEAMQHTTVLSGSAPTTAMVNAGSPEECRAYTGDAHLNCLYAYIEMQQQKVGKIESDLQGQNRMLGQLRDRIDQQALTSAELQQRLRDENASLPSSAVVSPPPVVYPGYAYPPLYPGYFYPGPGVSLYLGLPGYYGYYYGRPFYGPHFYGPRFYGPRFFGHHRH